MVKTLLYRPKDLQDNAVPSGNALACEALLKLAAFTDNGRYRDLAETALRLVSEHALRYPTSFARWLSAADFAFGNVKQVAVVSEANLARGAGIDPDRSICISAQHHRGRLPLSSPIKKCTLPPAGSAIEGK